MKNKIFNAINKGLENVLITDECSLINYAHSNINADFHMPTAHNLNELSDMIKNEHDIFSIDSTDCLLLVLYDNTEVPFCKLSSQSSKVRFIKITSKKLKETDNEILIPLHNKQYVITDNKNIKWSAKEEIYLPLKYNYPKLDWENAQEKCLNDLDGYNNTMQIFNSMQHLNNMDKAMEIPSIYYCQKQVINTQTAHYQGFLPAIGQLYIMYNFIDLINYIMDELNGDRPLIKHARWQSSSEFDKSFIWSMHNEQPDITEKKSYYSFICPIFKKID